MAIYISGVKGLPEQVQANKDDIKDLQDGTTALDDKLDTEIADRKELIEKLPESTMVKGDDDNKIEVVRTSKEIIFYLEGNVVARFDTLQFTLSKGILTNYISATNDIETQTNIHADGNIGASGNLNAGGNISTSLGSVKGLTMETSIINVPTGNHRIQVNCADSSDVNHVLKFDADTLELTIDGNGVGKTLYQHNIGIAAGISYQDIMLTLITDSATTMTKNDVAEYLYNKGFTSDTNAFIINQYCYTGSYWFARRIYATNTTTLKVQVYDESNNNNQAMTGISVVDQVIAI